MEKERILRNMEGEGFLEGCKELVRDYFNEKLSREHGRTISKDDVFVVWSCKILGNRKALLCTNPLGGMYYEITLNGSRGEIYLDAYKKQENFMVSL